RPTNLLPVRIPRPARGPGARVPDRRQPSSDSSTPGLLLGIEVISPGPATVNQAQRAVLQPETAPASRHTRAPPTLKPPSYTKPPVPTAARTRCASAWEAPASPTMPYTAGPHELCPTPTAPHARSRSTSSPPPPRQRPPTLQHEASVGERPRAHAGAAPAMHRVRQRRHVGRQTRQLGARARDRQRELGARAEPRVCRNRPMQAEVEPQVQPVVPREPAREFERPGPAGPFGLEPGRRARP